MPPRLPLFDPAPAPPLRGPDTCRRRRYPTEDAIRRVQWALALKGLAVHYRYCATCHAWHLKGTR